jgi:hypothetical protein
MWTVDEHSHNDRDDQQDNISRKRLLMNIK